MSSANTGLAGFAGLADRPWTCHVSSQFPPTHEQLQQHQALHTRRYSIDNRITASLTGPSSDLPSAASALLSPSAGSSGTTGNPALLFRSQNHSLRMCDIALFRAEMNLDTLTHHQSTMATSNADYTTNSQSATLNVLCGKHSTPVYGATGNVSNFTNHPVNASVGITATPQQAAQTTPIYSSSSSTKLVCVEFEQMLIEQQQALRHQLLETTCSLDRAQRDAEYWKNKHRVVLHKLDAVLSEVTALKLSALRTCGAETDTVTCGDCTVSPDCGEQQPVSGSSETLSTHTSVHLELAREETASLRAQNKQLSASLDRARRSHDLSASECSALKRQVQVAMRQWDLALRERNESRSACMLAQQRVQCCVRERGHWEQEYRRACEELAAANDEVRQILSERESVHGEMERLQEENTRLQAAVAVSHDSVDSLDSGRVSSSDAGARRRLKRAAGDTNSGQMSKVSHDVLIEIFLRAGDNHGVCVSAQNQCCEEDEEVHAADGGQGSHAGLLVVSLAAHTVASHVLRVGDRILGIVSASGLSLSQPITAEMFHHVLATESAYLTVARVAPVDTVCVPVAAFQCQMSRQDQTVLAYHNGLGFDEGVFVTWVPDQLRSHVTLGDKVLSINGQRVSCISDLKTSASVLSVHSNSSLPISSSPVNVATVALLLRRTLDTTSHIPSHQQLAVTVSSAAVTMDTASHLIATPSTCVRSICVRRRSLSQPLGLSVRELCPSTGSSTSNGVFVSRVHANGACADKQYTPVSGTHMFAADSCDGCESLTLAGPVEGAIQPVPHVYGGSLYVGDQLLEVCGINLRSASRQLATSVLAQCTGYSVQILAQYNPAHTLSHNFYTFSAPPSPSSANTQQSQDGVCPHDQCLCDIRGAAANTETKSLQTSSGSSTLKTAITLIPGNVEEFADGSCTNSERNDAMLALDHLSRENITLDSVVVSNTLTRTGERANSPMDLLGDGSHAQERSKQPSEPLMRKLYLRLDDCNELGIRLAGGNRYGVFVQWVSPHGAAYKAGVMTGDRILEYRGVDLRNVTAEQATLCLSARADSGSRQCCMLVMQDSSGYEKACVSTSPDCVYVRALFDHTPQALGGTLGKQNRRSFVPLAETDVSRAQTAPYDISELKFVRGDILLVQNTMYRGGHSCYWLASLVDKSEGRVLATGIIPSRQSVERIIQSQCRRFDSLSRKSSNSNSSNSSFRRSIFRRKSKQNRVSSNCAPSSMSADSSTCLAWTEPCVGELFISSSCLPADTPPASRDPLATDTPELANIMSSISRLPNCDPGTASEHSASPLVYERVHRYCVSEDSTSLTTSYRPVLLFGPLAPMISERLCAEYPSTFCTCRQWEQRHAQQKSGSGDTQLSASTVHVMLDSNAIYRLNEMHSCGVFPICVRVRYKCDAQIGVMYETLARAHTDLGASAVPVCGTPRDVCCDCVSVLAGTSVRCLLAQIRSAVEEQQGVDLWVSSGQSV